MFIMKLGYRKKPVLSWGCVSNFCNLSGSLTAYQFPWLFIRSLVLIRQDNIIGV